MSIPSAKFSTNNDKKTIFRVKINFDFKVDFNYNLNFDIALSTMYIISFSACEKNTNFPDSIKKITIKPYRQSREKKEIENLFGFQRQMLLVFRHNSILNRVEIVMESQKRLTRIRLIKQVLMC